MNHEPCKSEAPRQQHLLKASAGLCPFVGQRNASSSGAHRGQSISRRSAPANQAVWPTLTLRAQAFRADLSSTTPEDTPVKHEHWQNLNWSAKESLAFSIPFDTTAQDGKGTEMCENIRATKLTLLHANAWPASWWPQPQRQRAAGGRAGKLPNFPKLCCCWKWPSVI